MGNPLRKDVHIDQPLTNFSVGYKNSQFAADMLAPIVPVQKASDKYFVFGDENLRLHDVDCAPGADSNEFEWSLSNDSFNTVEMRLKTRIVYSVRDNADSPVRYETSALALLLNTILLANEYKMQAKIVAANFGDGTGAGTGAQYDTLAAGDKWDVGTSDPIKKVIAMRRAIENNALVPMNALAISQDVIDALKVHPAIKERFIYTKGGIITNEDLRNIFEVEKLIPLSCVYISSNEGATTKVKAQLWNKTVIGLNTQENPTEMSACWAKTFLNTVTSTTARWQAENGRADFIEPCRATDIKVVDKYAGYALKDVIS